MIMNNPKYCLSDAETKRAVKAFRKLGKAIIITAEEARKTLEEAGKRMADISRRRKP